MKFSLKSLLVSVSLLALLTLLLIVAVQRMDKPDKPYAGTPVRIDPKIYAEFKFPDDEYFGRTISKKWLGTIESFDATLSFKIVDLFGNRHTVQLEKDAFPIAEGLYNELVLSSVGGKEVIVLETGRESGVDSKGFLVVNGNWIGKRENLRQNKGVRSLKRN